MPVYERLTAFGFSPNGHATYRYFLFGDTTKPVVVLIPGYTEEHSEFSDLAEHLKRSYCVIIPDLPGWKESANLTKPLTIHNYVAYFRQLLDFLGLKSVVLVGHCFGCAIAIEFAWRYPSRVRELFLVSTTYLDGLWVKPVYLALVKITQYSPKLLRSALLLGRRGLLNLPLDFRWVTSKVERKKLGKLYNHVVNQASQLESEVEENWISYLRFSFRKISRVRVPVHLIHGGSDVFIKPQYAQKLKKHHPRATFDLLSRAGHMPMVEAPEALASIILGYLHPRKR